MKSEEKVYLELFIELNAKTIVKGKRILHLISEKLKREIFVEGIHRSGHKEVIANCYLKNHNENQEQLIIDTLIILDKIGKKWIIDCTNLNHKSYWKFTGSRTNNLSNFKVNGIKSIKFELTNYLRNREFDFIVN